MHTVLCCVGTRPEVIKMAPVVYALRRAPWARLRLLATDQHADLLDQTLAELNLVPDRRLGGYAAGQSLAALTGRLLPALDAALVEEDPAFVLAQGDTTSVLVSALAAFYRRIPFGHVEAGLRTGDLERPFPEELNRVLVGRMANLHLAPTPAAKQRLLSEGTPAEHVHCVGNTVVDALQDVIASVEEDVEASAGKLLLVTAHRRESFGPPIERLCAAVKALVEAHPEVEVLWPVHPNPGVATVVAERLGECERVRLVDPLPYPRFVLALQRASVVLSDSGGVQEEATALGKPLLVLRESTERPEALDAGALLVGTDPARIQAEVGRLLAESDGADSPPACPFGDGRAARRIAALVGAALGVEGVTPLPEFVPQ